MDECMPRISRRIPGKIVNIYIESKYVHEHVVGEHVDCHRAYIGKVSLVQGTVQTTYIDLVLDQTLHGGVQNDRLSRDLQVRNQSVSTTGGCRERMTGRSGGLDEDDYMRLG